MNNGTAAPEKRDPRKVRQEIRMEVMLALFDMDEEFRQLVHLLEQETLIHQAIADRHRETLERVKRSLGY
jgi:DNA-directed RNA polymerase specialized sigma24 family protein